MRYLIVLLPLVLLGCGVEDSAYNIRRQNSVIVRICTNGKAVYRDDRNGYLWIMQDGWAQGLDRALTAETYCQFTEKAPNGNP